jgi:hypothetical protein
MQLIRTVELSFQQNDNLKGTVMRLKILDKQDGSLLMTSVDKWKVMPNGEICVELGKSSLGRIVYTLAHNKVQQKKLIPLTWKLREVTVLDLAFNDMRVE